MIFDSNSNSIEQKLIVEYMEENELIFITVLDKIFSKNPNMHYVHLYPFFKNSRVDSLITSSGYGMIHINLKDEYINSAVKLLNEIGTFSIYGATKTINILNEKIDKNFNSEYEYYVMQLTKDNFKPFLIDDEENYIGVKCDESHFKYLKKLQYLYHKEEVYREDKNYPYYLEMKHFKRLLNNRLNIAIFENIHIPKAISKCNVNANSKNCYQIGGVFTLEKYRNKNLATYCVSRLIGEIFRENNKNRVMLYVKKENGRAIRVYEKLGFIKQFESKLLSF